MAQEKSVCTRRKKGHDGEITPSFLVIAVTYESWRRRKCRVVLVALTAFWCVPFFRELPKYFNEREEQECGNNDDKASRPMFLPSWESALPEG